MSQIASMAALTQRALTNPATGVGPGSEGEQMGPMEAAHQSAYEQRLGARQTPSSGRMMNSRAGTPLTSSLNAAKGLIGSTLLGTEDDKDSDYNMLNSDEQDKLKMLENDHSIDLDTYKGVLEAASTGVNKRRQMTRQQQEDAAKTKQQTFENQYKIDEEKRQQQEATDRQSSEKQKLSAEQSKYLVDKYDQYNKEAMSTIGEAAKHTHTVTDPKDPTKLVQVEDDVLKGARNFIDKATNDPNFEFHNSRVEAARKSLEGQQGEQQQGQQPSVSSTLPKAPKPGTKLTDKKISDQFFSAAGNDVNKAKALAAQAGWTE